MADSKDQFRRMDAVRAKQQSVFTRLLELCRHAEPALRDRGMNHQADRIAALISEHDAYNAELQAIIMEDPRGAMMGILDRIERNV